MIQSNAFESNASANANADESNANASANASAANESSASANANAAFALAFANASAFEHKPGMRASQYFTVLIALHPRVRVMYRKFCKLNGISYSSVSVSVCVLGLLAPYVVLVYYQLGTCDKMTYFLRLTRARMSSKNLLVRRTSRFTKPLVRNEIHLSVIKSTFLVSSMKIIKSNVYLMLRPNIVLRCRLSSTYIIINIIIKKVGSKHLYK